MTRTSVTAEFVDGNITVDGVDRALLRCVQLAPRASFRRFGEVLDLAEQTVARRYRRLRETGCVRVTAIATADVPGRTSWHLRLTCPTGAVDDIATGIARRADTAWVCIAPGNDIVCAVTGDEESGHAPLESLSIGGARLVSSALSLHRFAGGTRDRDSDLSGTLSPEQEQMLHFERAPAPTGALGSVSEVDTRIVAALEQDGRATFAHLADAAGLSESAATRRAHALLESGAVTLEVDIAPALLGRPVRAWVWLTVAPAALDRCGREIARLPAVAYAAAVTGPRNILVSVECGSVTELYRTIATDFAGIDLISGYEVVSTGSGRLIAALRRPGPDRSGPDRSRPDRLRT